MIDCNYENIKEPRDKTIETVDRAKGPLVFLARDFVDFVSRYKSCFITTTRSVATQAKQYLCGLMGAEKRNMERMAEVVPDSDDQALQNFLTNSPWSERAVMDKVAQDTDALFGDDADTCLIVDETGIVKKGTNSVGVARQWCGRAGKIENCQVGVLAALSCREQVTLIDGHLYLPESWVNDPERCKKAGIPEEHIVFKKKTEQALEIVKHAHCNNIRFKWVGADGGYGKEPEFLRSLDSADEVFVVDVHRDQQIYLKDPKPVVPEPKTNRGRKPTRLVAQNNSQRVDRWAAEQPESAWQRVTIRKSTQGDLKADILHRRVWLWDGEEKDAHCWHLIVRREISAREEIKYTLSNAPCETSTERLAFMQGQRYWVERSIQDGKSECGLAEYQARKWNSWHHHIALVMMAMLFMLETRLLNRADYPLLSCADIQSLLSHFLPRRDVTVEEVMRQMEERHTRRQASIDSAYRKQARHISSRGG